MSRWTVEIEPTDDGRYQWRHVPVGETGTGTAHVGGERFDSAEAARAAGEAALAEHDERRADEAAPEVPAHDADTRLGESQAELEAEEDPRL
ncbi:MAG: hypothetical protein REJ24_09360 [Rhodocyclaceae bacterium]|nr:hypothetical protein [Pseudomonadota bacterium]MDQ7972761.1 hypothetical protein [Rhodocyclaceae bacterium]MDQ8000582.1 hypothetical protein [Pseudomonadota bacterium]MDQ8016526.1 hypothetical protein [Pseudomonadota bacterium]